jgi:hypothetical protein
MVVLAALGLSIWQEWLRQFFSVDQFNFARGWLGLIVVLYTAICVLRLSLTTNIPRRELIAISLFWTLAPPIWFYIEYSATANFWISGLAEKSEYLNTIKEFAGYGSKIWVPCWRC